MLRTNSKKALENLDSYLMEHAEDIADNYGLEIANMSDFANVALNHCFYVEMIKFNKNAGRTSYRDLFGSWAAGLALPIFDYYYCNAKDIVSGILEETEEEASRYTEEAARELLTTMIWNRLNKLTTIDF